jgi:UPF0042 nucleotide-binding protein
VFLEGHDDKVKKKGKSSLQPKKNKRSEVLIVIVTGLSGSGKTVALRALEDTGFFCVDNLPLKLIGWFVSIVLQSSEIRKIGIGIDIREKEFLSDIEGVLKALKNIYHTEIIFLEAEPDVLVRRYRETRRPHPLGGRIEVAIRNEKRRLSPLREAADRIIDTTSFTPHQLRHLITSHHSVKRGQKPMTVILMSFGFKFGAPHNADLLFDARFLPNPHFVTELSPLTGMDKKVSNFVFKTRDAKMFVGKLREFIDFVLPLYLKEGRPYITIGIGCTGGNHRSPAIVEKLVRYIKKHPIDLTVIHRDIR